MMVMIMIMLMMKMMVHLPKTLPSLITSYSPSADTYRWEPSSPVFFLIAKVDSHLI